MIHRIARSLACLALLLGAAGCGDGGDGNNPQANAGNGADAAGQKVRYAAFSSKTRHLDPALIQDTTSAAIAGQVFDTLYKYHYLKRPYELVPALAADMPEVSEDGLTYTIRIRDDVFFHDDPCFPDGEGRNVVAEDFIYSWKRIADVANRSPNWSFLQDHIVGLDEFRAYTTDLPEGEEVDMDRPVEGLTAVDDHTLRIKLNRPWPQMLMVLAHLPTAVVPREAVEHYGEEFINHPIGTGAFMIEQWNRGSSVVLVRNPDYYPDPYPSEGEPGDAERGLLDKAGEMMPFIDRVEISIIEEDQPYWLTFKKGQIASAGIPKDNFSSAIRGGELSEEFEKQGVELLTMVNPATFWVATNMEDPVIGTNLPLRRALSMAIDRDDYIELFLNGRGKPAKGPIPPTFEAYNPDLESPYTSYDVEGAKAAVAEAERVHGGPIPQLTLSLGSTDTTSRQMGQYLSRAWERVGLDVNVEYMDWPSLQRQVDNKSVQLFNYGWLADYPDAQNFLLLYYSKNASPGPNSTNYSNPEFDQLYEKVIRMPKGEARTELYRELEQMIVDDLPHLYSLHNIGYVLKHPWLLNYKLNAFTTGTFKYQDIDLELRREKVGR